MTTAWIRYALCSLLLLCLMLCSGLGRAQSSPEDLAAAKRYYEEGAKHYEAREYEAAREEFKKAYQLSHLPDLLFNLSRVAERLGHPDEAVEYLEEYLKERPNAPDRLDIEKKIAKFRHEEQEAKDRDRAAHDKEARDRQSREDAERLARQPPIGPSRTSDWRAKLPPWPALALLGGGTGLLIIGIGLGGGAIATARAVETPANGTFDPSLDSKGKALSNAAIVFDVLGVAALAAGGTWTGLWYYNRRGNRNAVRVSLKPLGPGLALSGSF